MIIVSVNAADDVYIFHTSQKDPNKNRSSKLGGSYVVI
jgi:hypothetical protein